MRKQIVPAGFHKWAVRPNNGLSIKILSTFLSKKELKQLVDRYMVAKKIMLWESLAND